MDRERFESYGGEAEAAGQDRGPESLLVQPRRRPGPGRPVEDVPPLLRIQLSPPYATRSLTIRLMANIIHELVA